MSDYWLSHDDVPEDLPEWITVPMHFVVAAVHVGLIGLCVYLWYLLWTT